MENTTVNASPRHRANLVGAIVVACVIGFWLLIPPVLGTQRAGTASIFRFFRQDTFYYLSVAANSRTGFYTFDGEHATTGFHPLWQAYITKLFELAPPDRTFQIHLVFWVSVVATVLGYILAGLAVYAMTNSKLLGILTVPGPFNLLFAFVFPFAGSPWSFMNGMESPLTVLFGGMLFLLVSGYYNAPERLESLKSFYVATGIVLSLMVLSRLDDIFLPVAFAVCVLIPAGQSVKTRLGRAFLLVLPTALVMCLYIAFNFYHTHMFLPISGVMKAGIALWDNLGALLTTGSLQGIGSQFSPVAHLSNLYRQIQMLFPPVAAILFILIIVNGAAKESLRRSVFLISLLVYVIFKALYNFVNVHVNYQGVIWYYTYSILVINFTALVLFSGPYKRFCEFRTPIKAVSLLAVICYFCANISIISMIPLSGNTLEYNFWSAGSSIADELQAKDPHVKIVEYEDGIINYALGLPTLHGLGFVLDREAYEAKKRKRMLEHAHQRGYDTIGSLVYIRLPDENMTSQEIERVLMRSPDFRGENLGDFTFKVLMIHKQTGATFISFQPKQQNVPDSSFLKP
ncbi:MAG TPA: hypothetical protein VK463_04155 [Desulfomonilaceae bacterium]|nr:hypothetical protein [Desulfomonilaceae bacterium]